MALECHNCVLAYQQLAVVKASAHKAKTFSHNLEDK